MGLLPVLAFATPLFGFSLTPPSMPTSPDWLIAASIQQAADATEPDSATSDSDGVDPADSDGVDTAALMERRNRIANIHRPLGIATWVMMTATVVLGYIQYHNLYGFFDGLNDNPCARGDAIFGNGQCIGVPYLHLSAAAITSALYFTTFGLSFAMPDPMGLDEGDSDYARRLRTHKLLRWVHFGGMMSQLLLGLVIGNGHWFGLDRANDYGTLQALATVHTITGFVTYGALTWAGALFVSR